MYRGSVSYALLVIRPLGRRAGRLQTRLALHAYPPLLEKEFGDQTGPDGRRRCLGHGSCLQTYEFAVASEGTGEGARVCHHVSEISMLQLFVTPLPASSSVEPAGALLWQTDAPRY